MTGRLDPDGVSLRSCPTPVHAVGLCGGPRPRGGPEADWDRGGYPPDPHEPLDMRRVAVAAPVEGVEREMWFVHVPVGG